MKGGESMNNREKKAIQEMVETAKYLARYDPQALLIANASIAALKVRCDLDKISGPPKKKPA